MTPRALPDSFTGDSVPFAPGSLLGLRYWGVNRYGQLIGRTYQVPWHHGTNWAKHLQRTTLSTSSPTGHQVAGLECHCGFYAFYDPDHARRSGYGPAPSLFAMSPDFEGVPVVAGVIEGFGRVTFGDLGFRCERARIRAVALPAKLSPVLYTVRVLYPHTEVYSSIGELADKYPITKQADLQGLRDAAA